MLGRLWSVSTKDKQVCKFFERNLPRCSVTSDVDKARQYPFDFRRVDDAVEHATAY
jgi:hypothetical protein